MHIENIDPDVVFIEVREESCEQYGVVDVPVDMCIAYCYCQDNDIPVEMVDYWKDDPSKQVFAGFPVAGVTLPVIAVFLLGLYSMNLIVTSSGIILGIGHSGIHLRHYKDIIGKD